jgi:CBS domain-containing protein
MGRMTETHKTTAVTTDPGASSRGTTNGYELSVRDIMTTDVVTATPDETVYSAAKRMSEN